MWTAALLMLISATALAQPPRGGGPHGRPPRGGPEGHGPMGPPPEVIIDLAGELKLKDAQTKQIKDLIEASRKEHVKLRADIELTEIDLRSELDESEPDEKKVEGYIDSLGALETKMRKSRIMMWLKIRKLLTKEQRAKLEELHEKRRQELREWRRRDDGPPPGPPPPP
jgi:Spy/CpxP family protein refolding chaperone